MSPRIFKHLLFIRLLCYFGVLVWLGVDFFYLHGPFRRALDNIKNWGHRLSIMTKAADEAIYEPDSEPVPTEIFTVPLTTGEKPLALVKGRPVTKTEYNLALHAYLYRRGIRQQAEWPIGEELAKVRAEVLESLLDQRRLEVLAVTKPPSTSNAEVKATETTFLAQFDSKAETDEFLQRVGMNAGQLRELLNRELSAKTWLEAELAKRVNVTEADAKAYFDGHALEFQVPELRQVRQLFITKHDKDNPNREHEIKELKRIMDEDGVKLEDLAKQFTDDPATKNAGGLMPLISRERVPKEFADVAFSLKEGERSQIFMTHLGWHIIELVSIKPAHSQAFDEAKLEILARLKQQVRTKALEEVRKLAKEQVPVEMMNDQ